MLSVDGFVKRSSVLIREGEPFLAYWHPHGYAFICTERAYTAHRVDATSRDVSDIECKRTRCPRSIITELRKQIKKLQKDPKIGPVCVVEFDGTAVRTEGGGLDELYAVPIPADSDPMDN